MDLLFDSSLFYTILDVLLHSFLEALDKRFESLSSSLTTSELVEMLEVGKGKLASPIIKIVVGILNFLVARLHLQNKPLSQTGNSQDC